MKKIALASLLVLSIALAGCQNMGPKATTGAVAGGVIGAVAGGVIGHQMGSGPMGALIGATVGVVGGGLIGNEIDKADQKAAAVNPNYLPIPAIVNMAGMGSPDDLIISEIKRTNSSYELTSSIIDYLKKNKVSDKVVDYMLSTAKPAAKE
ncbi:MAG: YMGG-like glycine zipper-containing protein [Candidatus Omnitrophota bacterium]|nr:YMGG-like glycine zipper-containing protein [Candidatus Omnitrophota bacterium]